MNYDQYTYLYPPRPETKIPVGLLGFYKKQGYIAQVKKNGANTVIFAKGDTVIFKKRTDNDHEMWQPLQAHIDFFSGFDKWNVFCAELLHSKVANSPHLKHQLYIYDQIVKDGVHLVGTKFEDRADALQGLWKTTEEDDQFRVNEYISVAKNMTEGFKEKFDHLKPEDEGLVLKDPKGVLRSCLSATSNEGWQVKCRILHKNYGF